MGVFDFVKDAGEKLGILENKEEAARAEAAEERNMGSSLMQLVVRLGLDVRDLRIDFDDGVATIHGKTETNADREKVILAVGNTRGVSKVDDRIEVGSAEDEARFVTVEKGDTLSKIAQEEYGDASKYPTIFEANKPMLSDPDLIFPGQVLRIPTLDG